jgi:hypothetical protein
MSSARPKTADPPLSVEARFGIEVRNGSRKTWKNHQSGWWFGTFIFFHMGIVTPTDFHICQRGGSTTNQTNLLFLVGDSSAIVPCVVVVFFPSCLAYWFSLCDMNVPSHFRWYPEFNGLVSVHFYSKPMHHNVVFVILDFEKLQQCGVFVNVPSANPFSPIRIQIAYSQTQPYAHIGE